MKKYKCKNCGYSGDKLIYEFNDYGYCIASNEEEPEYISDITKWVKDKGLGEAKISEPVGCPKCHAWGIGNFEII